MKVNIKKRKVGSLKDLAFETYEVENVVTLQDLLCQLVAIEQMNLSTKDTSSPGKITFGKYNENNIDYTQAIQIMKQDFEDGLFRVFFNEKEYTTLDEVLECREENECVLIRLVMMAGRLW